MDMRAPSLALAVVLLSGPVLTDPFPTCVPETVGLSSERLQHLSATLQSEVDRHRGHVRHVCENTISATDNSRLSIL
jgi:hypothetical protein